MWEKEEGREVMKQERERWEMWARESEELGKCEDEEKQK